ncbi:hypothetical protein O6P32_13210 [Phocaeicola sp. KGMB11183]|jgi:predicted peptidase|uniref:Mor transcription activator domain-containing protein n=1 Tax=Phocaeicola acetigenes TaxID=3016083 RepID=A0ABT4PKS6_9BACT|nr:hypothetical protein [Phocaeicola sp. KGMB11183]MCZ8373656.1 hypothetical protein [Phocaeicola sp. KGMB11183]
MNAYEFLTTHKGVMEQLQTLPVQPSDVRYLELFKDYQRLTSEGHKKTYILQYLADEYNVDERTIYRIVKKFSTKVEM